MAVIRYIKSPTSALKWSPTQHHISQSPILHLRHSKPSQLISSHFSQTQFNYSTKHPSLPHTSNSLSQSNKQLAAMTQEIPQMQWAQVFEKTGGPVQYKQIPVQKPGPDEV